MHKKFTARDKQFPKKGKMNQATDRMRKPLGLGVGGWGGERGTILFPLAATLLLDVKWKYFIP